MTGPEREGMLAVGDVEIHYEEYGSGKPLVLLHGNGASTRCFDNQYDDFSKNFRVVAVDSRGHGKSTHGNGDLTLYKMAEDTAAVIKQLKLGKSSVLGFSDGGNIAMILAINHPELIDRLVLSGPNAYPEGIKYRYFAKMQLQRIPAAISAMVSEEGYYRREKLLLMLKQPHLGKEELNSIRAQTLITAGENDMISETHIRFIHNNIRNSRLKIFEGGDHFVSIKKPEEYNREVLGFLLEQ